MSSTTTAAETNRLANEIAAIFLKLFGDHAGFRLFHAKGIVCEGTFTPTPAAAELSRAAHFRGGAVPVVVRFSDGTGVPQIPDGDPQGNPKGMAIRFKLPGGSASGGGSGGGSGAITDIVANGLNGFLAGTPADFVGFFAAVAATKPDSPKPTPLEQFLGSHPATLAWVMQPNPAPVSFATQAFFGNNAFVFVGATGKRQATRYQIIPVAGSQSLDAGAAAAKPPNFLMDELKARIAAAPVEFRLIAQLAGPGDPTSDATKVWPDSRPKVDLGLIKLTSVDPKSAQTEKSLTMDPTHLTDGIELSDDPLPTFRSQVYSLSIEHRMK
jgi:catalase